MTKDFAKSFTRINIIAIDQLKVDRMDKVYTCRLLVL